MKNNITLKNSVKVVVFGAISGLIWAVIAAGLINGLADSVWRICLLLFAGATSGVVVSIIFGALLSKHGQAMTLIWGLFSLPLGAFIFGFVCALLGVSGFNDGQNVIANAVDSGLTYAMVSVMSLFAIGLFPLAILTTYLLRNVVRSSYQPGKVA